MNLFGSDETVTNDDTMAESTVAGETSENIDAEPTAIGETGVENIDTEPTVEEERVEEGIVFEDADDADLDGSVLEAVDPLAGSADETEVETVNASADEVRFQDTAVQADVPPEESVEGPSWYTMGALAVGGVLSVSAFVAWRIAVRRRYS